MTRFAQGPTGARRLGLTVRGVPVLVEPRDADQQATAEALADRIAALGPATAEVARVATPVVPPALAHSSAAPVPFVVGQRVWCTVHGSQGECIVTEVGAGRNRDRIKISGFHGWCPAHNFRAVDR